MVFVSAFLLYIFWVPLFVLLYSILGIRFSISVVCSFILAYAGSFVTKKLFAKLFFIDTFESDCVKFLTFYFDETSKTRTTENVIKELFDIAFPHDRVKASALLKLYEQDAEYVNAYSTLDDGSSTRELPDIIRRSAKQPYPDTEEGFEIKNFCFYFCCVSSLTPASEHDVETDKNRDAVMEIINLLYDRCKIFVLSPEYQKTQVRKYALVSPYSTSHL